MKVENRAHQSPSSAFLEEGWYLDTPSFKGSWRAVFADEPGMGGGTMREEVSRARSHRVVMFFKEPGANFFRPPSPPHGGRKEAVVLIVVKR